MQQQGAQPTDDEYARSGREPGRPTARLPIVIATAVVVAPFHFMAFWSFVLFASCCTSGRKEGASAVAHALGFPMLHLAWLLDWRGSMGSILTLLVPICNSIMWGVIAGAAVSLVFCRRTGTIADKPEMWTDDLS